MDELQDKERCQSCGMPISDEFGNRGTEADGSPSAIYCTMCYCDGAFTNPDMTVDDMVNISVDYMSTKMGFDPAEAERISRGLIPTLSRWAS